ncbi:MAG: hypothetical protein ACOC93_05115, partial [Planctomycetota bacterium]
MTEQTQLRKLLVLHGPSLEAQGILPLLREHFNLCVAENMEAALDVMRQEDCQAVLADTADFLPLERGVVTQQASVVLDTIGDGVCIVGPSGELVWANRRLREAPSSLLDSLQQLCVTAFESFACEPDRDPGRGKRFSIMPE